MEFLKKAWGDLLAGSASKESTILMAACIAILSIAMLGTATYILRFRIKLAFLLLIYVRLYNQHKEVFKFDLTSRVERNKKSKMTEVKRHKLDSKLRNSYQSLLACTWQLVMIKYLSNDKQSVVGKAREGNANAGNAKQAVAIQLAMTWREKWQQVMPLINEVQQQELSKLIAWSEEASFHKTAPWLTAPMPDQSKAAIKLVLHKRMTVRMGKSDQMSKLN